MNYFISAGEASGDLHGSMLIEALRKIDKQAEFTFLGGDLMAQAAGCQPVIHYRQMAFMGFSEVLRNLRTIFGNFSTARRVLRSQKFDAVVLVDYPGFNLKLAKEAHKLGIPVFYYIAPKVWAWKQWRVKQLRKYVDRLLSILPFEPKWFEAHGANATYVGNPSRQEVADEISRMPSKQELFERLNLSSEKPLLLLVPGSRRGEIRNNLPIMSQVAKRHQQFQAIVAGAPGIDDDFYAAYTQLPVIKGHTLELMRYASVALVTSGTATLECALAGTPQVVCYRANGVKLSYEIMKKLLKVKYVSLPNLIVDAPIVPEMLVHLCTVDSVDSELINILPGTPGRDAQLRGYEKMMEQLGKQQASTQAAEIIYNNIEKNGNSTTK